jgi:hypothetical protein
MLITRPSRSETLRTSSSKATSSTGSSTVSPKNPFQFSGNRDLFSVTFGCTYERDRDYGRIGRKTLIEERHLGVYLATTFSISAFS